MVFLRQGLEDNACQRFSRQDAGEVMEPLSRLIPTRRLTTYSDDDVWRERIAIWRVNDREWFVLTPDSDLHSEMGRSFDAGVELGALPIGSVRSSTMPS